MNSHNTSDQTPEASAEHCWTTDDGKEPPEEHWEPIDAATAKDALTISAQHLAKLKRFAKDVDKDLTLDQQVYSLRGVCNALGINPPSNNLLYQLLGEGQDQYDDPVDPSEPFVIETERWLLEGILKFGEFNLVAAEEKLGKTALGLHIAARSLFGEETCLGVPLRQQIDGIVIVGPDANRNEYGKILRREGLVVDGALDPRVVLWHKGKRMPCLNQPGIKRICDTLRRFKRPMLIVDTLFKCTQPALNNPKITEGAAEYMVPHQNLEQALQAMAPDCVVTEFVCAHTAKGGSKGGVQGAMRGTSQATGDASHIVCLSWLTPLPEHGGPRTDYRRSVFSDGRDKGSSLICEIVDHDADGKWVCHGNAEQVMELESQRQAIRQLADRRKTLWTWMQWKAQENIEGGTFTTNQAKAQVGGNYSFAWDVLKDWEKKGWVEKVGENLPGAQGGGTEKIYKLAEKWVERDGSQMTQPPKSQTTQTAQTTQQTQPAQPEEAAVWGHLGNHPQNPLRENPGSFGANGVVLADSVLLVPKAGTPVEVLLETGEWQNSWVIQEGSTKHSVTVAKLGNPNLTRSGLRWKNPEDTEWIDVRPCTGNPWEGLEFHGQCDNEPDEDDDDII